MKFNQSWRGIAAIAVVAIISTTTAMVVYTRYDDLRRVAQKSTLPAAVTYEQTVSGSSSSSQPTQAQAAAPIPALPAQVNLAIPFTAQAPHANWSPPYKEFCEEASVLMVMQYLRGQGIASPAFADQEMQKIKNFEEKRFGYYEDTNAEETAIILKEYYKYPNVKLVVNPTATNIKQALAAGKPVIMPAAGRQLGNPYYRPPGPLYHMIVIKGYTAKGQFIVNDPGTRHGADYLYSEAVLMNALHDWRTDAQIDQGRRVILIVG